MMSPKKLFAAAVASLPLMAFGQTEAAKPAEAAPAAAPAPAAPVVQVYGTINVNTQVSGQQGVVARANVSTDSSNIGVRANVDLGMTGYKGTVQCETSANVDGIDVRGICNRNSRVGITTPFGTLWYGNWDTPFKAASYGTKVDDPFGNTDVYAFQSIMGSPGNNYRSGGFVGAPGNTVGGFDVRAQNSVGFHSAKWSGVSFKLQYSVAEFSTAAGKIAPALYSGVVNYDQGPVSLFAAAERHEDAFGISGTAGTDANGVNSMDWAWRVGAGYELPLPVGPLTVSAMVDQLYFGQEAVSTTASYNRLAWQVAAKQRIGKNELRARYSQAFEGRIKARGGEFVDAPDTDASMLALGYAYYFTPAFQTYVSYAQIWNDTNATYTFSIGGDQQNAAGVAGHTKAGNDPYAVGAGFRFAF